VRSATGPWPSSPSLTCPSTAPVRSDRAENITCTAVERGPSTATAVA
jgi:hypothetical protein